MAESGMVSDNIAPASKSFKCCKTKSSSVRVCIKCGELFHISCGERFKLKIIDKTRVICCSSDDNDGESNIITELMNNFLVKELFHAKDQIINEMKEKNEVMKQFISTLNNFNIMKIPEKSVSLDSLQLPLSADIKPAADKVATKNREHDKCMTLISDNKKNVNKQTDKGDQIGKQALNVAIHKAKQANFMDEIIHLVDNKQSPSNDEDGFQLVRNKKARKYNTRQKHRPIIGTFEGSSSSEESTNINVLKVVPKRTFIHVSRLDPNTTCENLLNFVKLTCPQATCEALTSRMPTVYSSFKVSVTVDQLNTVMDPSFWPKGILVNKFFQKRPGTAKPL